MLVYISLPEIGGVEKRKQMHKKSNWAEKRYKTTGLGEYTIFPRHYGCFPGVSKKMFSKIRIFKVYQFSRKIQTTLKSVDFAIFHMISYYNL